MGLQEQQLSEVIIELKQELRGLMAEFKSRQYTRSLLETFRYEFFRLMERYGLEVKVKIFDDVHATGSVNIVPVDNTSKFIMFFLMAP